MPILSEVARRHPGQRALRALIYAILTFGAMGISPDTPLPLMWTAARTLRYADGPDEVHLRSIARMEIKQSKANPGSTAAYFTLPD